MNKTLYEEALADAMKLRELAEETAKHRVIESIMPQIKSLVDSRIIGEQSFDLDTDSAAADLSFVSDEPEPHGDTAQEEAEHG